MTQKKLNDRELDALRMSKAVLGPLPRDSCCADVFNRIYDMVAHRTSDGKPWKEPDSDFIPTDEWLLKFIHKHGRRPNVLVRNYDSQEWKSAQLCLVTLGNVLNPFSVLLGDTEDWFPFCKLNPNEPRDVD